MGRNSSMPLACSWLATDFSRPLAVRTANHWLFPPQICILLRESSTHPGLFWSKSHEATALRDPPARVSYLPVTQCATVSTLVVVWLAVSIESRYGKAPIPHACQIT